VTAERHDLRKWRAMGHLGRPHRPLHTSGGEALPESDADDIGSRFPLVEAGRPRGVDVPLETVVDEPSSPPPPPAPRQGLYDLPALLARIWSVPAAQSLSTSGSYATRLEPRSEGPSPADAAPMPPEAPRPLSATRSPWGFPSHADDPSLPLAAVPSLTLPLPTEVPRPPPSRSLGAATSPGLVAGAQYAAWRHPPCHLSYQERPPSVPRCLRPLVAVHPVRGLFEPAPNLFWTRRELMMRPATPAGKIDRFLQLAA